MNEHNTIAQQKQDLRTRMRCRLQAMSESDQRHERIICDRARSLPAIIEARTIMAYLPLPGEVDCTHLIESLLASGVQVAVPCVQWADRSMMPSRLSSLKSEDLVADRFGVRIPKLTECIPPDQLQAVLVPGLAFDSAGRRLGRGGGFYDRFLAGLEGSARTIGLAFEWQIVEVVPTASHDARVSQIVTEARLITCGKACE